MSLDAIGALERLAEELQELISARDESIVSGKCRDFAEYTGATGEVRGLRMAKNTALALRGKLERE